MTRRDGDRVRLAQRPGATGYRLNPALIAASRDKLGDEKLVGEAASDDRVAHVIDRNVVEVGSGTARIGAPDLAPRRARKLHRVEVVKRRIPDRDDVPGSIDPNGEDVAFLWHVLPELRAIARCELRDREVAGARVVAAGTAAY